MDTNVTVMSQRFSFFIFFLELLMVSKLCDVSKDGAFEVGRGVGLIWWCTWDSELSLIHI